MNPTIRQYIKAYENLETSTINNLLECIDEHFIFSDPFHTIKDKNELKELFIKMFQKFKNPRFKIVDIANNEKIFFIKWNFSGAYKKKFSFDGISEIRVKNNLIVSHIDYWDSGSNFYCQLPIIGQLFRKIHD